MSNNRDIQQEDLEAVRDDWWIPVALIAPDKTRYGTALGTTNPLLGDVRKESKEMDPETGGVISVKKLSITIRIKDLERVPQENEKWFIEYPDSLLSSGTAVKAAFNSENVSEGGESLGWIKIYPQELESA